MGVILEIISFLNSIFSAWQAYENYESAKKTKEDAEKQARREQAIDDSKKAESDDEIWKSQDGIVSNLP